MYTATVAHWLLIVVCAVSVGCLSDDDDDSSPCCGGQPDATAADGSAGTIDAAEGTIDAGGGGPPVTLSVSPGAGGRITSDVGGIDCASDGTGTCQVDIASGTAVTLTAVSDTSFQLVTWNGDCAGSAEAFAFTLSANTSCGASFLEATGQIDIIDPPTSVVPHATEDDEAIMMFVERINFELPIDLIYDTHVPAQWDLLPRTTATIPAGTRVDVWFVHFDPVGVDPVAFSAEVVMPNDIIGLVLTMQGNDDADTILGLDSVIYPAPGEILRAMELNAQDQLIFHPDRRRVTMNIRTGASSDQMRIVTVADGGALPMPLQADQVEVVSAPASVALNQTESTTRIRLFDEQSGVMLASDLAVDAAAPGFIDTPAALTGGTIAAGTTVSSALIHFDAGANTILSGSYDFGRPIAGIIVQSANLDASDATLGAAATTYPAPGADATRGVELGANESIQFGSDGQSLWFSLDSAGDVDEIRVVFAD